MFYASIVFEIFAYKYDFFVQLVQSILKYNRGIYMPVSYTHLTLPTIA